jgi:hypothetical protein
VDWFELEWMAGFMWNTQITDSQRDRGLLPHRGLTRRTPVCSGKAGSFCGSAALPRALARQLRAHARGYDRSLRRESLWLSVPDCYVILPLIEGLKAANTERQG